MKNVTLNFLGMPGTGCNKTEARAQASQKIEQALAGTYKSSIVPFRKSVAILWRDPLEGWCSRILELKQLDGSKENGMVDYSTYYFFASGSHDYKECLESVRYHLAQNEWDEEELESSILWENDNPLYDQEAFVSWTKFQIGYRYAKAAGLSDIQAHEKAEIFFNAAL